MNLRKTTKALVQVVVALTISGAMLFAASGCNIVDGLLNLNYIEQWAGYLLR